MTSLSRLFFALAVAAVLYDAKTFSTRGMNSARAFCWFSIAWRLCSKLVLVLCAFWRRSEMWADRVVNTSGV